MAIQQWCFENPRFVDYMTIVDNIEFLSCTNAILLKAQNALILVLRELSVQN